MLPIYLFLASYVVLSRVLPRVVRYWRATRRLQLSRRVVVFSRYPSAGRTKTRLIGTLGASGAAGLQLLMTNHLLDTVSECTLTDLCLELRHHGGEPNQLDYWVGKREPLVVHRPQSSRRELGKKMADAFRDAFNEGAQTVVLMGSDIPGINCQVTQDAFNILEKKQADMVLGPAKDGGYYLVGMAGGAAKYLGDIFCGMDWGTEKVLQQQAAVAQRLGVKLKLLTTELSDVDVAEDLGEVEKCLGISPSDILYPRWSVVIPVLNERVNIERAVRCLVERADAPERLEIVIADGGSDDHPEEVVKRLSKELKLSSGTDLKLVSCKRGRGFQLNEGAGASKHKLLLFLHIDTVLPKHFDTMAWHTLLIPGVTAGAFQFGLDVVHMKEKRQHKSWWFIQQMRLLEWGTQKRVARYEMPYGDQGLFMWRKMYDKLGGYPQFRLMEDYEMISRIKKFGHVKIVTGAPALTSARRWEKYGYIRVTSFNSFIIFAYKCGVSPDTLARWYYGK